MEEKTKKSSKFYNPYPFLVRVLNDLEEPQLLAPQAHCKVRGGEYDQSPLGLLPVDKRGERKYYTGLGMELRRLSEEDLVNVAWAVLVADDRDSLTRLGAKRLIAAIKQKAGEPLSEEDSLPDSGEKSEEKQEPLEEEKVLESQKDLEEKEEKQELPEEEIAPEAQGGPQEETATGAEAALRKPPETAPIIEAKGEEQQEEAEKESAPQKKTTKKAGSRRKALS